MNVTKMCRNGHRQSLTFDVSDNDHDEEAVVVGVVSVVDTRGDLTGTDNFFQGDQHQLDGQERHTFIEEVQRAVKDKIPEGDRRGALLYCTSQNSHLKQSICHHFILHVVSLQ